MNDSRFPWLRVTLVWACVVIAIHAALAGFFVAGGIWYERTYAGKIFPGVSIDGIVLDGYTREEARSKVHERIDALLQQGLSFSLDGKILQIPLSLTPITDPDLAKELARYDVDSSIENAYAIGRTGRFWSDFLYRMRLRVDRTTVPVPVTFDHAGLEAALAQDPAVQPQETRDAVLRVRVEKPANTLRIFIEPEQDGVAYDLKQAIQDATDLLTRLEARTIEIRRVVNKAAIRAEDLTFAREEAARWMSYPPLTLTTDEKKWVISSSTAAEWLTAVPPQDGGSSGYALTVDPISFASSVRPLLTPFMKTAQDGFLKMDEQGKLVEFTAPVEGVDLAVATSVQTLVSYWQNGSTTIPLTLEKRVPKILGPDAERLGIREALGTGVSYYDGSPANRRHNISLGTKKVHGTLIAPGETFSLLTVLGAVNGANGWLPELVIKGNKTTPEYGGGLCQVGTTIFRTTLQAGLPVVERRNHSYRVRYYEPAGTDATIYEPSPDYRFRNDTGHHILVTTENKYPRLAYTIWGTSDGRIATVGKPRIYNIVPPPPKKLIETTELKPGQIKCTESAHAGASASLDYSVKYADGTATSTTFNSYYRPWGAVCLVGVEKITAGSESGVDETGVNNPN